MIRTWNSCCVPWYFQSKVKLIPVRNLENTFCRVCTGALAISTPNLSWRASTSGSPGNDFVTPLEHSMSKKYGNSYQILAILWSFRYLRCREIWCRQKDVFPLWNWVSHGTRRIAKSAFIGFVTARTNLVHVTAVQNFVEFSCSTENYSWKTFWRGFSTLLILARREGLK